MSSLFILSSIIHGLLLLLLSTRQALCSSPTPSDSFNGAPWQQMNDGQVMVEEFTYGELPPIVFSPTGRLHVIEGVVRAAKASNPRANLVMAMNCRDGIVILSSVTLSPYLNTTNNTLFLDSDSVFTHLSPTLVAATAGNAVDGQVLKCKLHQSCQSLVQRCGDEHMVSASKLARHIADQLQAPTQTSGKGKLLASHSVIVGNRELWRIDPTGQFWKCQATVVGRDADKAERSLYQRITEESNGNSENVDVCKLVQEMSTEDALSLLVECLKSTLQPKMQDPGPAAGPKTFWRAMVQTHETTKHNKASPRRTIHRGSFLPRKSV
eukprot:scaffold834_cov123-Cylindrotheca_fusiformis.AAC.5